MTIILSCKKDSNLNDPNVYLWKRELFSKAPINPLNNSYDPVTSTINYLVSTDYVYLTYAQVNKLEKDKGKDGTLYFYTYTRV